MMMVVVSGYGPVAGYVEPLPKASSWYKLQVKL